MVDMGRGCTDDAEECGYKMKAVIDNVKRW